MREGHVSVRPKPLLYLVLFAAVALGVALFLYAPDPLALIESGGRPSKPLAVIKWGGGLIALLAMWRLFAMKRISAGPEGLVVGTLLKRRRYDWSDLKSANLEGRPIEYALRFGGPSVTFRRSDYAERDIAKLRDVVKAHHG
jgi:hypothetical protein